MKGLVMLEGNNTILKINRGDVIFKKGEPVTHLALLIKGSAIVSDSYLQISLQSGAIIGVLDINAEEYLFDYIASEATMICLMEYKSIYDISSFSAAIKEYRDHFVYQACSQLTQIISIYKSLNAISRELCDKLKTYYAGYLTLCTEYLKKPVVNKNIYDLSICADESEINDLELNYVKSILDVQTESRKTFFESDDSLAYYNCSFCSNLAVKLSELNNYFYNFYISTFDLLYNKGLNNIFAMYSNLSMEIANAGGDMTKLNHDMDDIVALIKKCKEMLENDLGLEFPHDFSRIKDVRKAIADKVSDNQTAKTNSDDKILLTYSDSQIQKAVKETTNALQILLEYSGIDKDSAEAFEKALTVYRSLKDPLSTEDSVKKIRSVITTTFYKIYENVYFKAKQCNDTSKIIDMFLNFGFMDERMLSKNQLVSLYYLDTKMYSGKIHVYTLRNWLDAIYDGKKEPSKNEFDLDFYENFKELKRSQAFSAEEEQAYLSDKFEKVKFELNNMVRVNNRLCSGHLLTFMPVLESNDFIGEVEKMYLYGEKVEEALHNVIDIDFSAFYREYLYEDKAHRIPKMSLVQEVLPDIILMPVVGQKSSMWQEISGKHRNSPARFIMPVFTIEKIYDMLIKMVGAFRWELCRTIQGTYWNDVREKSLTSEYCDYLQFYKKNHDLSEDAKEKIKSQYIKARNNSREMFVLDYEQWIKSESLGMSRLNKVARIILFAYCPFSKEYRKKVADMPMYLDGISKYDRERLKKIREVNNRITAIKNAGGEITPAVSDTLAYYMNQ